MSRRRFKSIVPLVEPIRVSVGPPLAAVPVFKRTMRRGDKRQPYGPDISAIVAASWFNSVH